MATVYVANPDVAEDIIAERKRQGLDRWDEVWDGEYVVMVEPTNEHQKLVLRLAKVLDSLSENAEVFPGCNVSDLSEGWKSNVRCPDVAVFSQNNPAIDHGTHWQGGPDLAIEIVSPGDRSREKIDFYSTVNTRELLIVDREPWQLELFQLKDGRLTTAGVCTTNEAEEPLASEVLPIAWQLTAGEKRPVIVVTHTETGQTWTV
ncbi:Uma2 family endonuclease [Calycomorphotria hydatis]|uniref:Putative restriction endonuclease domain-containing protein n=1 Tax=Calycomorphotria hydatis TaxID=2528027 RepID=A0A517TAQ8_9PLAN|nr:Uma2 family endonuclease [Calycomorphotria hydatis]QDT65455.1 hypothetical protein V22_27080 [Calycomorphotria hydatis]